MVTPSSKKGSEIPLDAVPPAGARRLADSTSARLREGLGEGSAALPFAEAVTLHLAHAPGRPASPEHEASAAARVLELLRASPGDAPRLADDPELLASVFQNADLLHAHGAAAADRVALLVMRALEAAEDSP